MTPRAYALLGILVVLLLALACPARGSLLLVGDSITAGQLPGPGLSFAQRLAADYPVVNAGCGGSTTGNWWAFAQPIACSGVLPFVQPNLFVARIVPNVPVDYAVVMLGTVDAAWSVGAPDYARLLTLLVDELTARGAGHVVLMTPPPWPDFAGGTAARTASLLGYRAAVLALCAERGLTCIDVYALLDPAAIYFFSPGDPHPNGLAHQVIANEVRTAVPEPGMLVLLGSGLIGLAIVAALDKRRSRP